jgi:hypothetical protein
MSGARSQVKEGGVERKEGKKVGYTRRRRK